MTFTEFISEINNLPKLFVNRDLETYLLAIYKNLEDNADIYLKEEATLELTMCILKESFSSEPAKFDKNWLNITESPDQNRMNRIFTNSDLKDAFDKTNQAKTYGIEFTMDVLRFQISDLHKMSGKQLKNKYKCFGIDSETSHRWYNFDPFTNLECGSRCMGDNEDDNKSIDWSFIGNLFEDGRVYE